MQAQLGQHFEREIREQPALWERLAASDAAGRLAGALDGNVVLVGSGSSLFAAQLGALALRRRGVSAHALAATEARLDHNAYLRGVVVAISQSGKSTDLLEALDLLHPRKLIALTNTIDSPLGIRADIAIDIGAGPEIAVPASKSVSATAAILLWAASLLASDGHRDAHALVRTARDVHAWLEGPGVAPVVKAAGLMALRSSVAVLGSDYGFAAGEFRHGSVAMIDGSFTVIGIIDDDAFDIVERPMREVRASGALRYTIGTQTLDGIPRLGPNVEIPFNTLAWLVTIQTLALYASRERLIESDAPRGLSKALVSESS